MKKPKLTIGLPSYDNPQEVWFTVQALRLYQDLEDVEILVLDNQGNAKVKKVARQTQSTYHLYNDVNGTGPARNRIFEVARGKFVLVIDSHVLLYPDTIKRLKWWLDDNWKAAKNLIQGPIVMTNLNAYYTHYDNQWRSQMWGTWPGKLRGSEMPTKPFTIEMMGLGLFGCRKDSWLGFHPDCKGFDGVEGVLHEKYRRNGRKVICLPWLVWCHQFGSKHTYPVHMNDKIRNFLLGFEEIGLDPAPIYEHFGPVRVREIAEELWGKRKSA